MAGYRRIPISPPKANNISLLAATDSISIPWDKKYQEGMGNIYLDINPTGDPQITVGSDLNPLIQERYLDIKLKPVLSKAQFGPVSSPVLRVIQSASVYVYKLELFNRDDLPEGSNLVNATPFWTEDMGLGPINSGASILASGGEFQKKIYYCEYRNSIRTKAHLVTNSWHNQYKYNWFTSQVTSQGILSIITDSRGIVIGKSRKGMVGSYYDPLEDSTFDWHDEYTDPYPRVSLDFYISQEANNIVNYKVIKWEVTKHVENYWPSYYLPTTKGDGYDNYLNIESQYQRIFTSGSTQNITNDISGDECSVEKDGVWGTYSKLQVNSDTNKVYFVEDNVNPSPVEFTITLVLKSEYSQEVSSSAIPIIQAPDEGLIKAYYGTNQVISGTGEEENFESSAYPKA